MSTTVLTVNFSRTKIGDSGAHILADALKSNTSITTLLLEDCGIEGPGVKDLAKAMATNLKGGIKTLNLSHNVVGESGALELAACFEDSKVLSHVTLSYAALGPVGGSHIAHALERPVTPIIHIELCGNGLRDEGIIKIANVLRKNKKVVIIDLQVC